MLKSCFGLSLRTGTSIIAIANGITSVCYIIFNIWHHYLFRKLLMIDDEMLSPDYHSELTKFTRYRHPDYVEIDETLNTVTLTFLLPGFTIFFANCELKYATIKNATHKIYLWLLVDYFQSITIVIMELIMLVKISGSISSFIGFLICFILVDAILAYQLFVVHSFYAEEKLIESNNYSQLVSKLASSQIEVQDHEEPQHVEFDY